MNTPGPICSHYYWMPGRKINGVGGYGTDQAYLRFKLNTQDKSKVVIMGFLTENIFRNVNQFRNLLYPDHRYALKPRFILDRDGNLELIPLINVSKNELYSPRERAGIIFKARIFFFLKTSAIQIALDFPYTLSVLKCVKHYYLQAKFAGKPTHSDFII